VTTETCVPAMATDQATVDDLVLDLLPEQGAWSEEEYLFLTDHTNRLIEYTDGYIEVLPVPTDEHQGVLRLLYRLFDAWFEAHGGLAYFAPLRVRIRPGKYREPDIVAVLTKDDARRQNRFWSGADLAVEVVSKDKPARDLVDKVGDYAEAGIPEYWIVNPLNGTITVLRLHDGRYVEHGVFGRGQRATSVLLAGFAVDVSSVLDAD